MSATHLENRVRRVLVAPGQFVLLPEEDQAKLEDSSRLRVAQNGIVSSFPSS